MNAFFTHEISGPLRNPYFPCARRRATDLLDYYYTIFYLLFALADTSNIHHFHFYHHAPLIFLINFYSNNAVLYDVFPFRSI